MQIFEDHLWDSTLECLRLLFSYWLTNEEITRQDGHYTFQGLHIDGNMLQQWFLHQYHASGKYAYSYNSPSHPIKYHIVLTVQSTKKKQTYFAQFILKFKIIISYIILLIWIIFSLQLDFF